MRSNPNETFGSRVEDFVRPGSIATFVLPEIGDTTEQTHFAHEVGTVLRDLLQYDGILTATAAAGGVILVTLPVKYPASIAKVNDTLQRVAERYTTDTCVWSWGPYNPVEVTNHNPVVEN
jgi:hypothetical protein